MLYLLLTGGEPFLWQDFWPLYEAAEHDGLPHLHQLQRHPAG